MKAPIQIVDEFCPRIDEVRASALQSGFGTWKPSKGQVGSSVYDGMNFWGDHARLLHALAMHLKFPIFPNSMFFRVTNQATEKAYVHSDRHSGSFTAIVYLSEHKKVSGTGFFRHRKSGLREMPSFEEMKEEGSFDKLSKEMVEGSAKDWEELDFVRGVYNRALIFPAPLFHARCPKNGFGKTAADGRLVWVCHFETFQTFKE